VRRKWSGLPKKENQRSGPGDRLTRLAAQIEALAEKDERLQRHAAEVGRTRQRAAAEIHQLCASFAQAVNQLLLSPELRIDPDVFNPDAFRDDRVNLIQLSVRGRILQVEYEATGELVSSEEFRVPYTLKGAIRSFNQEWLERDIIEEQLIFYCLERNGPLWRFFDARTYRSGPLDQDYLITLMEQLI
jgi:hypothetical protein